MRHCINTSFITDAFILIHLDSETKETKCLLSSVRPQCHSNVNGHDVADDSLLKRIPRKALSVVAGALFQVCVIRPINYQEKFTWNTTQTSRHVEGIVFNMREGKSDYLQNLFNH